MVFIMIDPPLLLHTLLKITYIHNLNEQTYIDAQTDIFSPNFISELQTLISILPSETSTWLFHKHLHLRLQYFDLGANTLFWREVIPGEILREWELRQERTQANNEQVIAVGNCGSVSLGTLWYTGWKMPQDRYKKRQESWGIYSAIPVPHCEWSPLGH